MSSEHEPTLPPDPETQEASPLVRETPIRRGRALLVAATFACAGLGVTLGAIAVERSARQMSEARTTTAAAARPAPPPAHDQSPVVAPAGPTIVLGGPLVSISNRCDRPPPRGTPGTAGLPPAGARAPVIGVTASRARKPTIAAWTRRGLAISRDGGHRFAAVERAPADLEHVTIARNGTVYALAGGKLGVLARGRAATWKSVPLGRGVRLVAAAGRLVWLGTVADAGGKRDAITVSTDHGTSWTSREVSLGNYSNDLEVDEDGRAQWMLGSEAACGGGGQARERGRIGGRWHDAPWPLDAPTTWMLGARGWAYAVDENCGAESSRPHPVVCAIGPTGGAPIAGPKMSSYAEVAIATNGRRSIAIADGKLLRLAGSSMKVVARDAPKDLTSPALDGRGRLWALHRGFVVRWRAGHGWRTVFPSIAAAQLAE